MNCTVCGGSSPTYCAHCDGTGREPGVGTLVGNSRTGKSEFIEPMRPAKGRTSGWIGVDLDGTLAEYGGWKGAGHIGDPVPEMLARVKAWLASEVEVRIVTARVSGPIEHRFESEAEIKAWCLKHVGVELKVTCEKDYAMVELWDDRAVQVEINTGRPIGYSTRGNK